MAVNKIAVLFSFVGNRDPYPEESEEWGPLLCLLNERYFHRVYLFCSGYEYFERARMVEEVLGERTDKGTESNKTKFAFINLDIFSPVDYEEVYTKIKDAVDKILGQLRHLKVELSILLDSGTPQMQTVWFLLARSGYIPARLLQGIPPRFTGGAYKVREVNLDKGIFPEIKLRRDDIRVQGNKSSGDRWITTTTRAEIIGESDPIRETLQRALRIASYDITVLIRGETGTGKELVAKFIHQHSDRAEKPFLPVNCASITSTLAESELFGHEKGAFTGASRSRLGQFRAADRGIVFLDEVGDLPPEVQPKLLRVLEEKTLLPLGADTGLTVDIRVIAATNKNLEQMIDEGTFRRDLYERLNQVTLEVPPLRERQEDIPLLSATFLKEWNEKHGENKRFSEEAMHYILSYPWPGNVRQLENTVISVCAVSQSDLIGPEILPPAILSYFNKEPPLPGIEIKLPQSGVDLKALLYQIERDYYEKALKISGGNREQAARLLKINPPAFRKALKERFGFDGSVEGFP
mgnify:CR=1 FL=1